MIVEELVILVRMDAEQALTGWQSIKQAEQEAGAAAKEAGEAIDSAAKRGAVSTREEEAAVKAFNRELSLTIGKLAEMQGQKNAAANARFKGFVSQSDLSMLADAKEQLRGLIASERELATAARQEASERTAAARAAEGAQERLNKALAETNRQYALSQRTPMRRVLDPTGKSDIPTLRSKFSGASESSIASLASARERNEGQAAGQRLLSGLANGAANTAVALTGIGAITAKLSSDFELSLTKIRNNTTMSDDEFKKMKQTVMDLGQSTGADLDKLAEGFMHLVNYGYTGAEASKLLTVSTRAAVATGADAATTGQLLAKVMREQGINVKYAADTMNALWYASAASDAKMEDLIENGGKAFTTAAQLGLGLKDTLAVMSLFMSRGMGAAQAATQFQNDLQKIAQPSKAVRDELEKLRAKGIDLFKDFTYEGLKSRQLSGVFADVRAAAEKMGIPFSHLAGQLFPNLRGTLGALVGTSEGGFKSLEQRLVALSDKAGLAKQTTANFTREQATTQAAIERLVNAIKVDFLPVGDKFAALFKQAIPVIKMTTDVLKGALDMFLAIPKPLQELIIGIGLAKTAAGLLGISWKGLKEMGGDLVKVFKWIRMAAFGAAEAEDVEALSGRKGIGGGVGAAEGVAEGAGGGLLARYGTRFAGGLATASKLANPLALTAGLMFVPSGMGNGQALPESDLNRRLAGQQFELKQAQADLAAYSKMSAAQRLDEVKGKFGTNLFGAPSRGRDEYWGDLRTKVEGLQKAIAETTLALQAHKIAISSKAGSMLGAAMVEHAADSLSTPKGQASCAYFASAVMKAAGANIPSTANAKALADKLVAAGAVGKPGSQAAPGDFLLFHGPGYGNDPAHREGYHAAIALGNGLERSSTRGVVSTKPFSDMAHATAYTLPDSLMKTGIPGLDFPISGGGDTSGVPAFDAMMHPDRQKHKKLTPYQRESASYAEAMAAAQAKLNELMSSGDKATASLAGKFHLLSSAQIAALAAINAQISSREEANKAEEKFRAALDETNSKIRAGRGSELEGLAKLKAEYPQISDARLKYLLTQQKTEEQEKKERETCESLKTSLSGLQSELLGTTAVGDKHRLAVELTKTAYESLSKEGQHLIDTIAGVKQALSGQEVMQKAQEAFAEAQAQNERMKMPKATREGIESIGQKSFDALGQGPLGPMKQLQFLQLHQGTEELKEFSEKADKAKEAWQRFAESMDTRQKAAALSILGDSKDAAWQKFQGAEGNKTLMDNARSIPFGMTFARSRFDQTYNTEQTAQNTNTIGAFNARQDESMNALKLQMSGQGDTAAAKWNQMLSQNAPLTKAFAADQTAAAAAFAKFKDQFKLEQQMSEIKMFADGAQGVFKGFFDNLMNGGKNIWTNLSAGFRKMFTDIASNLLASGLMTLLEKSLGKWLGMSSGGGSGSGSVGGSFADGGPMTAGTWNVVGENGPELVWSGDSGGMVLPNGVYPGGNTTHVHVTQHIHAQDAPSFQRSQMQIAQDTARATKSALARNGGH